MPLFNVYSGSGQTFSLEFRKMADDASSALMDEIDSDLWTHEIIRSEPGEIVRDKSGKEWFAVRVN